MPPAGNDLLLALDFGGTKHTAAVISAAALPHGGPWLAHKRIFSPPGADARYDLSAMLALARQLLDGAVPIATGVSFGGPVDAENGIVRLSHHVPGWENVPLAQILQTELGAPASIGNDANVAALGEHRSGAGQGASSLLYITISTGVGGGWILDGRPWRGADGMAGEIGHTVVDPDGPVCLCGKRGCVERLASGPFMAQDAIEQLLAQPERGEALRRLVRGNLQDITAANLSQAAAEGDSLAWELLERSACALGQAIGNAANLINPQRFILGGGVTKSGERYWEAIREAARRTALPEVQFEILPAALGDDAPLYGAAWLAREMVGLPG